MNAPEQIDATDLHIARLIACLEDLRKARKADPRFAEVDLAWLRATDAATFVWDDACDLIDIRNDLMGQLGCDEEGYPLGDDGEPMRDDGYNDYPDRFVGLMPHLGEAA